MSVQTVLSEESSIGSILLGIQAQISWNTSCTNYYFRSDYYSYAMTHVWALAQGMTHV